MHERVALPASRDELGQLAVTLNDMLERIERGAMKQRRLVTDASHDGLGLAICREVALAHGGTAWVESETGRGSTFFIGLPGWRVIGSDGRRSTSEPSKSSAPSSVPPTGTRLVPKA